MKHVRRCVPVVVALLVVAAACGSGEDGRNAGSEGNGATSGRAEVDREADLRFAHAVAPQGFDPAQPLPSEVGAHAFLSLVYDTLILIDGESTLEPNLATAWAFSEDGSSLDVELRSGITFSNGEPLDASAVKANLDRSKALAGSVAARNLASVTGVEVVDDQTVRLNLTAGEGASLPYVLGGSAGMMIAPAALADPELATRPVGSGAYTVSAFEPGVQTVFERRSDYWNDDAEIYNFATITYRGIIDQASRIAALASGQLDMAFISGTPFDAVTQAVNAGTMQLVELASNNSAKLMVNTTDPPLDDPLVRRAISHAVSRENLTRVVGVPSRPSWQILAPFEPGYSEDLEAVHAQDVDTAVDLLEEAGHADGFDMTVYVGDDGGLSAIGQVVQSDLAAIGIDVELVTVSATNSYALYAQDRPSGLIGQPGGFADPALTIRTQLGGPPYFVGPPDPQIVDLIADTSDPALPADDRALVLAEMNRIVTEDALVIQLVSFPNLFIAANDVVVPDDMPWGQFRGSDFRNVYIATGS